MRYGPLLKLATATVVPAALGLGLTAGLVPAAAAPQASPGVILGVSADPANPANWIVKIEGKFPMTEDSAYERLRNLGPGGGIEYTVHADDPGENDPVITSPGFIGAPGPAGGAILATPAGLAFYRYLSVPRSDLNEDDGMDEIYVRVRFVQQGGVPDLRANSEAIAGEY
jgi:hypothetical protein